MRLLSRLNVRSRCAKWPISRYSISTSPAAGGWLTINCSGCFNEGRLCRAPQRWASSLSHVGGRYRFIAGEKRVLPRVLGEKGVVLTAEARARLDALPERFMDFIAAPERFFARPEAEAA